MADARRLRIAAIAAIGLGSVATPAAAGSGLGVLGMRERVATVNRIRLARLERLLPRVMRQAGIDMWILAGNEDHYDPIFRTMVPFDEWYPITQILVLSDRGPDKGVERLSLSRTDMGAFHASAWDYRAWDETKKEGQWEALGRIVRERDPARIAIDEGEVQWAADALTATTRRRIVDAIGPRYAARLASAEGLATLWLETMLDEEIDVYADAVAVAHRLIAATFASESLVPGTTTLEDLRYVYWQMAADHGLEVATPPHFCLRRSPEAWSAHGKGDRVIRRGDAIHSDLVLRYLGYYTDHQEWAYVLREGETRPPEHYRRVLAAGNRLQDVFAGQFREGLTGNQLLARVLARAREAGIPGPKIYSHSIGHFLHEPGPLIGLPWEQRDTGPRGEVKLVPGSCFTAELSVRAALEEWGGAELNMGLEQVLAFTPQGVRFLDGRQTAFHLVGR
jgi:Xaa-Pro aminopeptidase